MVYLYVLVYLQLYLWNALCQWIPGRAEQRFSSSCLLCCTSSQTLLDLRDLKTNQRWVHKFRKLTKGFMFSLFFLLSLFVGFCGSCLCAWFVTSSYVASFIVDTFSSVPKNMRWCYKTRTCLLINFLSRSCTTNKFNLSNLIIVDMVKST